MDSEKQPAPTSKWMLWAGYIVTTLPVLGLLMSGMIKITRLAGVEEEFTRLGYDPNIALGLGTVEIACTVIYLIPRTAVLGAILLTGYLGGATATHLRLGEPFVPPIMMGVLVWLGLFLRDGRLRALVPWRK